MPTPIRVKIEGLELVGELNDTRTARAIVAALPFEGDLRAFGEQFWMETPVDVDFDENPTEEVDVGDVAYWHPGLALAFFFGPTPETPPGSKRPAPASEVTLVGRIEEPTQLRGHGGAKTIRVEVA